MSTLKKVAGIAANRLHKHWPTIATVLGGGLLAVGGYLLGKEIPNYKKEVKKREDAKGKKLTVKEKAPVAAKHFAGSAAAIAGGVTFLTAAVCENNKRIAVTTTACAISRVATKELEDHIAAEKEIVGEEKAKEIVDKVKENHKKAVDKRSEEAEKDEHDIEEDKDICTPSPDYMPTGMVKCYDLLFHGEGEFVWTSINRLKALENEYTSFLLHKQDGAAVSASEMYERVGFRPPTAGNAFAWIFDGDKKHSMVDLGISKMYDEDGMPCLSICPKNLVCIDPFFFEKPKQYW